MPPRAVLLLALAVAAAGATVAMWMVFVQTAAGRELDAAIGDQLHRLLTPQRDHVVRGVRTLAGTIPFAVGAFALVALAWLRRGPRLALPVALTLLVANVVTQTLQPAVAGSRRTDFSGTTLTEVGSWPSGHAQAAMLLALLAVVVAGKRLRAVTAIAGAGYALAVGSALLVLGGHLPSDVVTGYIVAAAFTASCAAGVAIGDRRPSAPRTRSPVVAPALGTLAAASVLVTAIAQAALSRTDEVTAALQRIPLLLGGAAAALAAVVLAASVALARARSG